MKQALDDIEAARNNEDGVSGVPSGFHDLDKLTGGWQRSDMIVWRHVLEWEGPRLCCLWQGTWQWITKFLWPFLVWVSAVQLVQRLISSETEINSDKFEKETSRSTNTSSCIRGWEIE